MKIKLPENVRFQWARVLVLDLVKCLRSFSGHIPITKDSRTLSIKLNGNDQTLRIISLGHCKFTPEFAEEMNGA